MTMKPFEIQSTSLSIGGVKIDTSAQGKLVIPGVTRAGTSVAIEVEDTGDQTYNFGSNADPATITVIDGYQFAVLNGDVQAQVGWTAATYSADEIDSEGFIDGISVVDGGSGYTGEAVTYSQQMLATEYENPLSSFDPGVWTWIPFRVRCGAGEIESEFGNSGGGSDIGDVMFDGRQITVDQGNNLILKTTTDNGDDNEIDLNSQSIDIYAYNQDTNNWAELYLNNNNASPVAEIVVAEDNIEKRWTFDKNGVLTLPSGGDIQINGQTVLGGGIITSGTTYYVMANSDGNVLTSMDGLSWSNPVQLTTNGIAHVATDGNNIVYVDGNTVGYTSFTNPGTATEITAGIEGVTVNELNQVIYGGGYFVVAGQGNDGSHDIPVYGYSTDGVTWTFKVITDGTLQVILSNNNNEPSWFADVDYNGSGFNFAVNSMSVGGGIYTTDVTETFTQTNYFSMVGGQQAAWNGSAWFYFNDTNGSGINTSIDPRNGYWEGPFNPWGDMSNYLGYTTDSDSSDTFAGGNGVLAVSDSTGHIAYSTNNGINWSIVTVLPYTSTGFSISQDTAAVITFDNFAFQAAPPPIVTNGPIYNNEKIVITGAGDYNGTYYVNFIADNAFTLCTDQGLTTPLDTSGFAAFGGGTVTFSHGQYIDALDYANGYFYAGNDDEQVFRASTSNMAVWTLIDDKGNAFEYWNDFYGYTVPGATVNTGDITFDGVDIQGSNTDIPNGSINLVPNPSLRGNGQFVSIYPTNAFDYPHVHMTAGAGGELYVGDDYNYVKTVNNGGIQIGAYDVPQNGNAQQWSFGVDGKLTLPAGGDIVDNNGASVLGGAGGNGLSPYVTVNQDSKVEVTTDIVFVSEQSNAAGYIISAFDPDHNEDCYFEASASDSDGVMYTVGYYYADNDYALVYATNPDGTSKWRTSIDQINGSTVRPNTVITKNGYVFVGFKIYDNNQGQDRVGVVRLNANDGSVDTSWVLNGASNSYPSIRDVAVDNNNDPIFVGQVNGEMTSINGVVAQAGSTTDYFVVNTIDILPSGSTSVENINWQIDSTGNGDWINPSDINRFENIPTVSVQGSGTGLTVGFRYSGGKPLSIWLNDPGTGYTNNGNGDYTYGEEMKIMGSSYGGVDGVNDLRFYIWTYNGGNNWTVVWPNQDGSQAGDTPTDKTYFTMTGGTNFTPDSTWNIRYSLNSQAYVWTPNWQHTYGTGSQSEEFKSVAYNNNTGDIYVGGNFYQQTPQRSNAVYKLDSSGNTVWAKYVEDGDSLSGNNFGSIALDGTGDYLFVFANNNNSEVVVTKLNTSDSSIVWSVKQTNRDGNNYWNNEPRGAVDGDGNAYITGSWTWTDNTYGLSITKLSGTDGSAVWSRKLNTTDNQSLYEYYNDDTQPFKVANGKIYYAGYTYDSNGNRNIGYALCVSTDGTGTGTYGRWLYEEDTTFSFTGCNAIASDGVFGATDGTGFTNDGDMSVSSTLDNFGNLSNELTTFTPPSGGTLEQVGSIKFADGSVQTTASGGAVTWTNYNNNTWRIEDYNGGASVQYWGGDDYSAKWFDIANHTSGTNNFRGAIIQYHAFIMNRGTMIGTIHLANDYTQESATHTEHYSGDGDLQFVTLWDCNNERGQLYFKMTNGQNWEAMIQWTAKVFYGQESYD